MSIEILLFFSSFFFNHFSGMQVARMTGPAPEVPGSATSTINRSKNRLGLLLKQYYDDPSLLVGQAGTNELSFDRLERLKTDALMGKSVESLRSYKEAEGELRMLLYNNCDKLLKAVHVVCEIREKSHELADDASKLDTVVSDRRFVDPDSTAMQYAQLLAQKNLIDALTALKDVPTRVLRNTDLSLETRIGFFLKLKEELFDVVSRKFSLIHDLASECRSVVDNELVPVLMRDAASIGSSDVFGSLHSQRASRLGLLMDLFPQSHERHGEIMEQFVELEIAGIDEKLINEPSFRVSAKDGLGRLNSLINLVFIASELRDPTLGSKIKDDLLPRASQAILASMAQDPTVSVDLVRAATAAHLRIPNVSSSSIDRFASLAISACMQAQFRSAARTCVNEDLPSLFAASAFGPCCDVIHTQCCSAIALVKEFLTLACTEEDELSHAASASVVGELAHLVADYYQQVALTPPGATEDMFVHLTKALKMMKFINNRKTVDRTVNALCDIFSESIDPEEGVVEKIIHRLVCLLGEWVGDSEDRLLKAINEGLVPVLDASSKAAGPAIGTRPSEIDNAERVHARRLVFSSSLSHGLLSLETGVYMVSATYLKAVRETAMLDSRQTPATSLPDLAMKLAGGPASEYGQNLQAMARDVVDV
jgi:hypothetical protein